MHPGGVSLEVVDPEGPIFADRPAHLRLEQRYGVCLKSGPIGGSRYYPMPCAHWRARSWRCAKEFSCCHKQDIALCRSQVPRVTRVGSPYDGLVARGRHRGRTRVLCRPARSHDRTDGELAAFATEGAESMVRRPRRILYSPLGPLAGGVKLNHPIFFRKNKIRFLSDQHAYAGQAPRAVSPPAPVSRAVIRNIERPRALLGVAARDPDADVIVRRRLGRRAMIRYVVLPLVPREGVERVLARFVHLSALRLHDAQGLRRQQAVAWACHPAVLAGRGAARVELVVTACRPGRGRRVHRDRPDRAVRLGV